MCWVGRSLYRSLSPVPALHRTYQELHHVPEDASVRLGAETTSLGSLFSSAQSHSRGNTSPWYPIQTCPNSALCHFLQWSQEWGGLYLPFCFLWWGCWRQWRHLLCATSKTLGMERTCLLTGLFIPLTIMVNLSSLTYTNSFQAALCRSVLLYVVDTAMV